MCLLVVGTWGGGRSQKRWGWGGRLFVVFLETACTPLRVVLGTSMMGYVMLNAVRFISFAVGGERKGERETECRGDVYIEVEAVDGRV